MPLVDVRVYYLEMVARPPATTVPSLSVIHVQAPSVAEYRALYHGVGRDYHWHSRGRLADDELGAILTNQLNEVHVLHVDDAPAGFAELDRTQPGEVELVQFGLLPAFIGRGLGRAFLDWTIARAWSYQPRRFWLHTCTLDHPRALPNYLKAGFTVYREEMIEREIG